MRVAASNFPQGLTGPLARQENWDAGTDWRAVWLRLASAGSAIGFFWRVGASLAIFPLPDVLLDRLRPLRYKPALKEQTAKPAAPARTLRACTNPLLAKGACVQVLLGLRSMLSK